MAEQKPSNIKPRPIEVVDPDDYSEPPDGGIPNFLKRKPVERYRRGS